jgi:hypothetical protein
MSTDENKQAKHEINEQAHSSSHVTLTTPNSMQFSVHFLSSAAFSTDDDKAVCVCVCVMANHEYVFKFLCREEDTYESVRQNSLLRENETCISTFVGWY